MIMAAAENRESDGHTAMAEGFSAFKRAGPGAAGPRNILR